MARFQQRLAQGDAAAFAELYDACAPRVGRYLLVHLRSRADAEDALQETFLRVTWNCRKLAAVDNLEAFVFAVARNEAARLATRRARRRRRQTPLTGAELFCDGTADLATRQYETAETVAAALDQLPPELREVVELKTYGQLTFQQISVVTETPPGTAATRYRAALAKMQDWLTKRSS